MEEGDPGLAKSLFEGKLGPQPVSACHDPPLDRRACRADPKTHGVLGGMSRTTGYAKRKTVASCIGKARKNNGKN